MATTPSVADYLAEGRVTKHSTARAWHARIPTRLAFCVLLTHTLAGLQLALKPR